MVDVALITKIIQLLAVAVTIGAAFSLLGEERNELVLKLFLASFLAVFVNIGYFMTLFARDEGELMIAIRVEYVGAAFIAFMFFSFMMDYLGLHVPRLVTVLLVIWHFFVLVLIFTYEYNNLYYSEVFMRGGYGAHSSGIVYIINVPIVMSELFIVFLIALKRILSRRTEKRDKRNYLLLIIGMLSPMTVYLMGLFKVFSPFDPVPPAEAVSILFFTWGIRAAGILSGKAVAHDRIIQNLPEPVLICDHEFKLQEMNRAAQEVFSEYKGAKEFMKIKDQRLLAILNGVDKSDIIRNGRVFRPDVQVLKNGDRIQGYAMILVDTTEEYNHLTEANRLKRAADKANRAKTDFLANMSHEIRTPINAVLGMDEMILRKSGDDNIRRYALDIKSAASSLLSLVNDLLDMSKIEEGRMEIIPVSYELYSLINDVTNIVRPRIRAKHLDFVADISPDLPSGLFGDDLRIRQVINNLLSNAAKYTEKGTVTLKLDGKYISDDEYMLRVSVRDTGIGIKEEDREGLFRKFQRLDEEKNRNIEGTGLGMNITVSFLKLMGSTLKVESTYGEGSEFSFEVKQKVVDKKPLGNMQSRKELEPEQQKQTRESFIAPGAKILVVDDNDINLTVFTELLSDTAMEVDACSSGKECLSMITMKKYDIIFLDHMMPEMDGIECLHAMPSVEGNKNNDTPVVIVTANAVKGSREQYLNEGFSDYISKPVNIDRLTQLIVSMLPEGMVKRVTISGPENEEEKTFDIEKIFFGVPDIDEKYALSILGKKEIFLSTITDYRAALPRTKKRFEELLPAIEKGDADSLKEFEIAVHALKSTSKMVGAFSLFGMAYEGERTAASGDFERTVRLIPLICGAVEHLHSELEEVLGSTGKAGAFDESSYKRILSDLKIALSARDYDRLDEIADALRNETVPDEYLAQAEALTAKIDDLDIKGALALLEE